MLGQQDPGFLAVTLRLLGIMAGEMVSPCRVQPEDWVPILNALSPFSAGVSLGAVSPGWCQQQLTDTSC